MKTDRIYFYDNLKFILITLVVIGHFLLHILDYQISKSLFLFIYAFHMPLFIFITGFLSKRLTDKNGNFRLERILGFMILYIIFKILIYVILKFIYNQDVTLNFFVESDCPWYLLTLPIWISLTFIFNKIKPIYMLIGSITVALLVGYEQSVGTFLCLSRVLVFYPFFLTGYYLSKENMNKLLNKLHTRKIQIISIIFLLCLFTLIYLFADNLIFFRMILTGQNNYSIIPFPYNIPLTGLVSRAIMYLMALIISIAVLSLVPRRKTFFSKFGERTMQVYILHFLILQIFINSIYPALANILGNFTPLVYILIAIALSFILSNKWLSIPFEKITNLNYNKIYKK